MRAIKFKTGDRVYVTTNAIGRYTKGLVGQQGEVIEVDTVPGIRFDNDVFNKYAIADRYGASVLCLPVSQERLELIHSVPKWTRFLSALKEILSLVRSPVSYRSRR